ncbi:MAG: hypothetical protein Q9166_003652 [cf. Caloplaca sp. 2 TL-2023]
MWFPIQTLLVLSIATLPFMLNAWPIPNDAAGKPLIKRFEIQDNGSGEGGGGDGGGGGWEDFGDSGGDFDGDFGGAETFGDSTGGGDTSIIEMPTVEVTGHRDDAPSAGTIPSGIDPHLVALNEEKGLSWGCALQSVVGGWEAGLACSLLEDKYGKGEGKSPKKADPPKTPAPPSPPASKPVPVPPKPAPPPKSPAPAPVPKKNDSPSWRGVGPVRAIPRMIRLVSLKQNYRI